MSTRSSRRPDGGASDIHFEPYGKYCRIRFRRDGLLREISHPPAHLAARLAARLKVMSRLDIAERRVPQDGRIRFRIGPDREIDFRVNTLPGSGTVLNCRVE